MEALIVVAQCGRATLSRRLAVLCVVAWAGCSKAGPPAGTEHEPCNADGTCNAGLTCRGNRCVNPATAAAAGRTLSAKVEKYTNELCACPQHDPACGDAVLRRMRAELSEAEAQALEHALKSPTMQNLRYCMNRMRPGAKQTQAHLQLTRIAENAKRVYAETSSFVDGTAAQMPRKPGTGGCCGGTGEMPNHCRADPAGFGADPVWKRLDFQIDEDSLFYYDYTGTRDSFTARATGDLDCDGTEIVYTLLGKAVNGVPEVQLLLPPVNAD